MVRIALTLAKLHQMYTKSIDFTTVCPQVLIKTDIFLHTSQGIELNGDPKNYVLKLVCDLYGLKDAGRMWWQHLSSSLEELEFVPRKIDPCVNMKEKTVLVC